MATSWAPVAGVMAVATTGDCTRGPGFGNRFKLEVVDALGGIGALWDGVEGLTQHFGFLLNHGRLLA